MSKFLPRLDLTPAQVEAMARGLYAVAASDGLLHEQEAAMIKNFFVALTGREFEFSVLFAGSHIEGAALASALTTSELKQLFLRNAMLLAYTDGTYGTLESQTIGRFCGALGVTRVESVRLEGQVGEFLLSSLPHPLKAA